MTQCAYCNAPDGKPHTKGCQMNGNGNGKPQGVITPVLYPDSKNKRSWEQGMEFQDFVVRQLNRFGLYIQLHASKMYQFEHGESVQMAEIKLDNRCLETGRLSIEVGERTSIRGQWVQSGIYRSDKTIFYIQGNQSRLYLFDRRVLQRWHIEKHNGKFSESPNDNPTVRKFYLPLEDADFISIFRVDCTDVQIFMPTISGMDMMRKQVAQLETNSWLG